MHIRRNYQNILFQESYEFWRKLQNSLFRDLFSIKKIHFLPCPKRTMLSFTNFFVSFFPYVSKKVDLELVKALWRSDTKYMTFKPFNFTTSQLSQCRSQARMKNEEGERWVRNPSPEPHGNMWRKLACDRNSNRKKHKLSAR